MPNVVSNGSLRTERDFKRLDRVIATGMATFKEVGSALMEIKSRRLYRSRYETFEGVVPSAMRCPRGAPTS